MSKLQKIGVIAPQDRFNYGDLLFAIVLDFCFKKKIGKDFELDKYSIVDADFTKKGGFKSKSYKTMVKDIESEKIESLIVGGGESLGGTWSVIFSYINSFFYFITYTCRFYKIPNYSRFAMRLLGGKSENPFNINKNDFNNKNLKVLYNSVGCSYLTQEGYSFLKLADYIAVRDQRSYDSIYKYEEKIFLVPDCAIVLSDVYKETIFEKSDVLGDFVFIQLSPYKIDNQYKEIASQINEIMISYPNISIVLCPIGTAAGHKDHLALRKIKNTFFKTNEKVILIENPTIKEIINLIKDSQCYIGTSLHGMITAMSYGVPYIVLNNKQKKIDSYLATWSVNDLKEITNYNKIKSVLDRIIHNDELKNEINNQTIKQKQLYYESFDRIYSIVN